MAGLRSELRAALEPHARQDLKPGGIQVKSGYSEQFWSIVKELAAAPATEKESTMQDWQQRVIEERDELAERINKLGAFIGSKRLPEVTTQQDRALLVEQLTLMERYYDVLCRRVEAFQ